MIDYNCFTGSWPFHKIRRNSFSDIKKLHEKYGVETAYISKIESIFYNDPYESELELYEEIKGTGYKQVMTVNPTLDIAENIVKRAIKELDIKGVRILPGYHGFSLFDDCVTNLVKILKENNLPLFINSHLEDERVSYLIHPVGTSIEEIGKFIKENKDIEIQLCTIGFREITLIKDAVLECDNVYFDTSGFKDKLFAMPGIREEGLSHKARFGSMAPLFCFESSYLIYNEED